MYFDSIVNPKTGRKVSIYSKLGKSILKNYMQYLKINTRGGSSQAINVPDESRKSLLPNSELTEPVAETKDMVEKLVGECTDHHDNPVKCNSSKDKDGNFCVYSAGKVNKKIGRCGITKSSNIEKTRESARRNPRLKKKFLNSAAKTVQKKYRAKKGIKTSFPAAAETAEAIVAAAAISESKNTFKSTYHIGAVVHAPWKKGGAKYRGKIVVVQSKELYTIRFDDGDERENIPFDEVFVKHNDIDNKIHPSSFPNLVDKIHPHVIINKAIYDDPRWSKIWNSKTGCDFSTNLGCLLKYIKPNTEKNILYNINLYSKYLGDIEREKYYDSNWYWGMDTMPYHPSEDGVEMKEEEQEELNDWTNREKPAMAEIFEDPLPPAGWSPQLDGRPAKRGDLITATSDQWKKQANHRLKGGTNKLVRIFSGRDIQHINTTISNYLNPSEWINEPILGFPIIDHISKYYLGYTLGPKTCYPGEIPEKKGRPVGFWAEAAMSPDYVHSSCVLASVRTLQLEPVSAVNLLYYAYEDSWVRTEGVTENLKVASSPYYYHRMEEDLTYKDGISTMNFEWGALQFPGLPINVCRQLRLYHKYEKYLRCGWQDRDPSEEPQYRDDMSCFNIPTGTKIKARLSSPKYIENLQVGEWKDGKIAYKTSKTTYTILFDDGKIREHAPMGEIKIDAATRLSLDIATPTEIIKHIMNRKMADKPSGYGWYNNKYDRGKLLFDYQGKTELGKPVGRVLTLNTHSVWDHGVKKPSFPPPWSTDMSDGIRMSVWDEVLFLDGAEEDLRNKLMSYDIDPRNALASEDYKRVIWDDQYYEDYYDEDSDFQSMFLYYYTEGWSYMQMKELIDSVEDGSFFNELVYKNWEEGRPTDDD